MGFAKPKAPSAPKTAPPVITANVEQETTAGYDQRQSRKKGILATILTERKRAQAPATDSQPASPVTMAGQVNRQATLG